MLVCIFQKLLLQTFSKLYHDLIIQNSQYQMFDEDDYISDEEDTMVHSHRNMASEHALAPSTGSNINHLESQGQSLMKMMKERGFDLTENEVKKMKEHKNKDKGETKPKSKTGFFDGGDKATVQQLTKALNKAFSQADPQQASCILSYILEKTNLSIENRNKFSIMKCNILFGLGAYEDCITKAQEFIQKPYNKLSAAIFSNFMAKTKSQTDKLLTGYMDYLRAKSLLQQYKQQLQQQQKHQQKQLQQKQFTLSQQPQNHKKNENTKKDDDYTQSQYDTTSKQIYHTQMEYNIKMSKYKNNTNLVLPYFNQFRHRKIAQVVCGDFHTLFLVSGALASKQDKGTWSNQVFGLGENTVGQITGRSRKVIYKQPIMISQLSGKNIQGVWASRQSSLAYDNSGNIYEWGIKPKRSQLIQLTYTINDPIQKLEKGDKHYAVLTKSKKFYLWGAIEMNGAVIYTQAKPYLQDTKGIVGFSCGSSHVIVVESGGDVYALGSNEAFQLGFTAQRMCKNFKKIQSNFIGKIKNVFCINDCSFFANYENEVYFCGRYSYKKEVQQKFRQAQFVDDFNDIISISGSTGTYYASNEKGNSYQWDVDNMVKFKLDKENQQFAQRYVQACKGVVLKVKSLINPQLCKATRTTKQLRTYEHIAYQITLQDEYGLYGIPDFIIAPKCQIFLSTYKAKKQELLKQNNIFIQNFNISNIPSNKIILNQIVEKRLLDYKIARRQEQPWLAHLEISIELCGKYYFYIIFDDTIILEQELDVQISEREKQLESKNKQQRLLKEEDRRKKAELERQRLAQQKLRKEQQQQQKKRQTQRRAEQALKKHLRAQQQAKVRQEQDRKARKQLLTGGGFDLTKMKKKSTIQSGTNQQNPPTIERVIEKTQKIDKIDKMQKTGESFLPDINQRPNSRKKVNLPKPSQLIGSIGMLGKQKSPLLKGNSDFSSTGFSTKEKQQSNPIKQRSNTPKQLDTIISTATSSYGGTKVIKTNQNKMGTTIMKRGVSNKKK